MDDLVDDEGGGGLGGLQTATTRLRGHQRQSEALKGPQRPSEAISGPSHLERVRHGADALNLSTQLALALLYARGDRGERLRNPSLLMREAIRPN